MANIICKAGLKTKEEIMNADFDKIHSFCNLCNNFVYRNGIGACVHTLAGEDGRNAETLLNIRENVENESKKYTYDMNKSVESRYIEIEVGQ